MDKNVGSLTFVPGYLLESTTGFRSVRVGIIMKRGVCPIGKIMVSEKTPRSVLISESDPSYPYREYIIDTLLKRGVLCT